MSCLSVGSCPVKEDLLCVVSVRLFCLLCPLPPRCSRPRPALCPSAALVVVVDLSLCPPLLFLLFMLLCMLYSDLFFLCESSNIQWGLPCFYSSIGCKKHLLFGLMFDGSHNTRPVHHTGSIRICNLVFDIYVVPHLQGWVCLR